MILVLSMRDGRVRRDECVTPFEAQLHVKLMRARGWSVSVLWED